MEGGFNVPASLLVDPEAGTQHAAAAGMRVVGVEVHLAVKHAQCFFRAPLLPSQYRADILQCKLGLPD
jgi:beta-phosphoglucomutase-like phosphatase (HAD superfamily)